MGDTISTEKRIILKRFGWVKDIFETLDLHILSWGEQRQINRQLRNMDGYDEVKDFSCMMIPRENIEMGDKNIPARYNGNVFYLCDYPPRLFHKLFKARITDRIMKIVKGEE